jgi:hypothetical protein
MAHVLFHRPTVWASDIQCSTKVLARLTAARRLQTTYLQAPLDPVHLLRGPGGYLRVWRQSPFDADGVRVVTPATPVPVRDIWPLNSLAAAGLRYRLALPGLRRLVGDPDLIWTTVPGSGAALRRIFPRARLVFHVVDYYPAFRGDAVKPLEQSDYSVADAVYTIGHSLADYVVSELGIAKDKVRVLGQGADMAVYAPEQAEPAALTSAPAPRAVWTGVLGKGDPGLFEALAQVMQARGGSLILIGPGAPWADALAARFAGTVRLVGSVAPAELPAWLRHCDLGVMLYDRARQEVYRGQNPLKLYEYAAAGLPALSTPHDEFAHLEPPVLQVRTEAEIGPAIARALSDAPAWRARVAQFAQANTWQSKVDRILADCLPGATVTEAP